MDKTESTGQLNRVETRAPVPLESHAKSTAENIKETLESIVVAFILAFVFRAFIVEAFVIPTGSMAVTLYGNQATNTCSTCGFEYARGIDQTEQATRPPLRSLPLRCPNCDTTPDEIDSPRIVNPDSGDRILVHKWPLDIGGPVLGPNRWDVTVFKDPMDGQTNFIKRLVGLPGEVLEIIDGDVYTASLEATREHPGLRKAAPGLAERLEQLRLDTYNWGHGGKGSGDDIKRRYAELNKELLPHLRIRRKIIEAPRAQESLWANVYDHDYLPNYARFSGTGPTRVGWHDENPGAKAWNTTGREITFRSAGPQPLFIRFDGKPINDYSAYNSDGNNHNLAAVGDIRLKFTWFRDAGNGGILLQTNRDDASFIAEIGADGSAKVIHKGPNLPGGQSVIAEKSHLFEASQNVVEVEFMHVDYLVRLIVNSKSCDAKYDPQPARMLTRQRGEIFDVEPTQVRIGARAIECRFRHVQLQRDVYYRDGRQLESRKSLNPQGTAYKDNPYHNWPGWGTSGMPILLREAHQAGSRSIEGEYFMLGDNSAASKDSRLWWEIGPHLTERGAEYTVGTVPGDQLIGEAFFVYWPAGYRRNWAGNFGIVANIGRMRWIR